MSRGDRLEQRLARAGEKLRPADDWQGRVWQRIDRPWATPTRVARLAWAAGILAIACAALFAWTLHQQSITSEKQRQLVEERQRSERQRDAAERKIAELEAQIAEAQQAQAALGTRLSQADSEAERIAIRQDMEANKRKLEALREQNKRGSSARMRLLRAREAQDRAKIKVTCDPSDPLCGL